MNAPSATGRPSSGFFTTADAVGGDQQQEQTDTDAGAVRHAHRQVAQDPARMPVTEIMVNSTPIRNTAPSATGMLMCWPSTS